MEGVILVTILWKEKTKMMSNAEYRELKKRDEEGILELNSKKTVKVGSLDWKNMKEYESQFCEHPFVETRTGNLKDKIRRICLLCEKILEEKK